MSSFQRRLDMLAFIPRQPRKITTRQLIAQLEQFGHDCINLRTIQRDLEGMEKLGLFGLEVDKRSKPFGWFINNNWKKLNLSLMDANTALAFSTLEQLSEALLPEQTIIDLQDYFDKAKNIIESEQTPLISQWRNSVAMITNPLPIKIPEIDKHTLKTLKSALFSKKQFSAKLKRYFKKYDTPVWKDYSHINPLGLIHSDGMPILLCTFGSLHKSYYTFPLTLIKDVKLETTSLNTPKGFDFAKVTESYQNNAKHKTDIVLKIHARKDCLFVIREAKLSDDQQIAECKNPNLLEITATVKDSPQLKAFLRGLGHGVEVIEPAHLRKYFKDMAEKLSAMYQDESF